jgi:hypothetical protein
MEEEWKDIVGHEGHYRISSQGRVMSLKRCRARVLKQCPDAGGYMRVSLFKNKRKSLSVHRMVAQHFLTDWDESLQVDHINGVKEDQRADNLRMVTNAQNCRSFNAKRQGCTSEFRGVCWNKRVQKWQGYVQIDLKRSHLGFFDDEEEAARAYDAAAIENGYNPEALNFK